MGPRTPIRRMETKWIYKIRALGRRAMVSLTWGIKTATCGGFVQVIKPPTLLGNYRPANDVLPGD